MIPYVDEDLLDEDADDYDEAEELEQIGASKTYQIDVNNKRILSTIDGLDAVSQTIYKIFQTDKYVYPIYDWYYGHELQSLVGKPMAYVKAEIPRIVQEALQNDDRIQSIEDYEIEQIGIDSMSVSFVVKTIYGNVNYNMEVSA